MKLIKSGAEHFLIINVADVGALPETRLAAEYQRLSSELTSNGKLSNPIASAGARTRIFNLKLSQVLNELNTSPGGRRSHTKLFDSFDYLAQVKSDALMYGFINIEDACVDSARMKFSERCTASTANKYLYFDEIHFSQAIHQLLAGELYDSL